METSAHKAGAPGWLKGLAALACLPMLAGCFAAVAVAVPAATAVGLVTERKRVRAATPRQQPAAVPEPAAGSPRVVLTQLTELPPPGLTDPEWQPFLSYARTRAGELLAQDSPSAAPAQSALLAPEGASTLRPILRPCRERTPAVLIDLDAGDETFSGALAGNPPANLAVELDRLRQAGVVVLWITRAPAAQVGEVGRALAAAGLDPHGQDPLLLVRRGETGKQTLREDAARDVCVIAIAGDERSDFDELFDYLRDPASATMLDSLMGSGWFMVPPPLSPQPSVHVPEADSQVIPPGDQGQDGGGP